MIYLVIRHYTLSIAPFFQSSNPPDEPSVCVHLSSYSLLMVFFLIGSGASIDSSICLVLKLSSLQNGSPKFKAFRMYCWRFHSLFITSEIAHLTYRHLLQLFLVFLSIRHKTLSFEHPCLHVKRC